jgi:hypothetical protein
VHTQNRGSGVIETCAEESSVKQSEQSGPHAIHTPITALSVPYAIQCSNGCFECSCPTVVSAVSSTNITRMVMSGILSREMSGPLHRPECDAPELDRMSRNRVSEPGPRRLKHLSPDACGMSIGLIWSSVKKKGSRTADGDRRVRNPRSGRPWNHSDSRQSCGKTQCSHCVSI